MQPRTNASWKQSLKGNFFSFLLIWIPFFGFTQAGAIPEYDIEVTFHPAEASCSGKEKITWVPQFSTHEIPFLFYHKKNTIVKSLIQDVLINGRSVSFDMLPDDHLQGFIIRGKDMYQKGKPYSIELVFNNDSIPIRDNYLAAVDEWLPLISYGDTVFNYRQQGLKNFSVSYRVPVAFTTATTGSRYAKEEQQDYIVYKERADKVMYYGICMSDKFLCDSFVSAGIKIYSYYFPGDEKWGKKLGLMTSDIVNFYVSTLGFYPSPKLSLLPGGSRPNGGYPISSAMFVIHRGLDSRGDNFANWITAHETGHFYWGFGYTTTDAAYTDWFGLSMGIFTDWLYANDRKLDLGVYNFDKRYMAGLIAGYNTTILQPIGDLVDAKFDYNNVISHGKSFTVLLMLHDLIGHDKFMEIYKRANIEFATGIVTYAKFKALCEKVTKQQLDWFFDQWYKTNAFLDFSVQSAVNKTVGNAIWFACRLKNNGGAWMPVTVRYEFSDGSYEDQKFPDRFSDTTFTISVRMPVRNVIIDPEKQLPLLSRYQADSTTLVTAAMFILNEKRDNAYDQALKILSGVKEGSCAGSYLHFLKGYALRHTGDLQQAIVEYKIAGAASVDEYAERSLFETGQVYDLLLQRKDAIFFYNKAIAGQRNPMIINQCKKYLAEPYKEY